MSLRLALALVAGLIGAALGLLFGPIPALALTQVVHDALFASSNISEEALLAAFWGASILLTTAVGVATGLLIDRLRRAEADARRDGRFLDPRSGASPDPDDGVPRPAPLLPR